MVILLSLVSFTTTAQASDDRGFMLFGGFGLAGIEYESEIQDFVDQVENQSDVDRFKLHLNLGLGFAVTQRVYLTGSIIGYSDIFTYEDASIQEELQITFVNLAAGVRFYPDVTGWVAGFDIGPAGASVTFDANYLSEEVSNDSDDGVGFGLMVGYDFSQRATGFSAIIGARADFIQIEDDSSSFASLFFDIVFK